MTDKDKNSQETKKKNLGRRIRRARGAKGLTQLELGERVGLSTGAIKAIESGKTAPGALNLESLCKELGISMPSALATRVSFAGREAREGLQLLSDMLLWPNEFLARGHLRVNITTRLVDLDFASEEHAKRFGGTCGDTRILDFEARLNLGPPQRISNKALILAKDSDLVSKVVRLFQDQVSVTMTLKLQGLVCEPARTRVAFTVAKVE